MIADIIIILFMALCVFLGYKKGLIGLAVKILGFIVSLIIALILYTPVSNYIIDNTNIVENLQKTIESKLYVTDSENEEVSTMGNQEANIMLEQYMEDYTNEIKNTGAEYVSEQLALATVRVRNMDRVIYYS